MVAACMCWPIIKFPSYKIQRFNLYQLLIGHLQQTDITGTHALPHIYARAFGLVHIYLAKHSSLWYKYKYNINLCLNLINSSIYHYIWPCTKYCSYDPIINFTQFIVSM